MAHTPGPWSQHGKGGCECGQIFGPDGNVLVAEVLGPSHLSIEGPDCVPSRDRQIANCALIAAAPDLLAALKAMVEPWHGFSDVELKRRHLMGAIDTPDLERIAQARAAIKAAEGGA
jgi:hypothetical protein